VEAAAAPAPAAAALPPPPPLRVVAPAPVALPAMADTTAPAPPPAHASLSKKLDAKSCDHILCLTKEMARDLLPPVPAAWGGGPVQLSVEVVDDAGTVWPMTYRCVPSRYSYELRAGWKQFAAAARVGVGDVVHLAPLPPASPTDAPRIRLHLERAARPPPPPPGGRGGGGKGGAASGRPAGGGGERGASLLAAVARAAEAEAGDAHDVAPAAQ